MNPGEPLSFQSPKSNIVLVDRSRRKRLLWPMFFINFEDLDNRPNRSLRLANALHLGLLGAIMCSAALLFTLFLVISVSQSGVIKLDGLQGSLITAYQQAFVILISSLLLLFLPLGILIFAVMSFIRMLSGSVHNELTLPYLAGGDVSVLPALVGGLLAFIVICFLYLDFDFSRQQVQLSKKYFDLQGATANQKKMRAPSLALEILEFQQWNLRSFRDFVRNQILEGIAALPLDLPKDDLKHRFEQGELTQDEALWILEEHLKIISAPKTRTRSRSPRSRKPKNPLTA